MSGGGAPYRHGLYRHAIGLAGVMAACLVLSPTWAQEADRPESNRELLAGNLREEVEEPRNTGGNDEAERGWLLPQGYRLRLGGQYRMLADAGNFGFHDTQLTDDQESKSSVNQRLRTWIGFGREGSDGHGVYVQLEVGHTGWGDDREFTKTNRANDDEVGVELRRGFLWWKPSGNSLVRVGVQDWHDRFGERPTFEESLWTVDAYDSFRAVLANSIWDFNVGGVSVEGKGGEAWHYRSAVLFLGEGDETLAGDGSALLLGGDIDVERGSALLGGSAYFVKDEGDYSYGTFGGPDAAYDSSRDLWLGVRGHFTAGSLTPSFFAIYNQGSTDNPDWEHDGWALKGATGIETPIGKLDLQALYSTGDDGSSSTRSDEFRTIAQSERDNLGSQGYWSMLGLTSPRGPSDTRDLGVGLQNQGRGLMTVQASLMHEHGERLATTFAAGWLRAAEKDPANGERDIGAEILAEISWKVGGAMRLDAGAGYLLAGDYWKSSGGGDPDDLYEVYARLQLEF
jgi:hypothetical protein